MKRYLMVACMSIIAAVFTASCASGKWSYTGSNGPENWGGTCADGKVQSPIDITAPFKSGKSDLKLSYGTAAAEVENNGYGLKVKLSGDNTLTTKGKTFNLVQFHFHTPSEYAINGKRTAAVAHLVHASADGELAVVGLLYDEGAKNGLLAPIFDAAPAQAGGKKALANKLNVKAMLPRSRAHYAFMGSLTTPPCSEGVNWFVMKSVQKLSADQLKVMTDIVPDSARPLQPRNDREIISTR